MSKELTDLTTMEKSEVSKSLFGLIQWEEVLRSGVFLGHTDHQLLERAQQNLAVILDSPTDAKVFATMLLKIADNCTSNLTVQQYVFTRIEEILGLGMDFSDADVDVYGSKHAHLFTADGKRLIDAPFLRALNSPDIYLQKSASLALACLYTRCEGNVESLVQWINSKFSSPAGGTWEIAAPALSMVARKDAARKLILSAGCVGNVVSVLTRLGVNGNAQHVYELCFILWTMSLGCESADLPSFLSAGTIRVLYDLCSSAPSRKVVRMAMATLANLARTENPDVLTEMLTAGLDRQLETMIQSNAHKQANDPEFEVDVKFLHDVLARNYRDLSTFDRWASEVQTGALRWGIVHTDKFWRENAKMVEADEFKLLKQLISLLQSSDPTIVSIALYDLGEFTRYYPNGRVIASRLKGKDIALQMIGHPDPNIQTQALQCISKIMVTNWEFMR
jgi:V-type H+-transporting ATPase subunit H